MLLHSRVRVCFITIIAQPTALLGSMLDAHARACVWKRIERDHVCVFSCGCGVLHTHHTSMCARMHPIEQHIN